MKDFFKYIKGEYAIKNLESVLKKLGIDTKKIPQKDWKTEYYKEENHDKEN